jgi:hypothetical protein
MTTDLNKDFNHSSREDAGDDANAGEDVVDASRSASQSPKRGTTPSSEQVEAASPRSPAQQLWVRFMLATFAYGSEER